MQTYVIRELDAGVKMGTYDARNAEHALDQMAQEIGYVDFVEFVDCEGNEAYVALALVI